MNWFAKFKLWTGFYPDWIHAFLGVMVMLLFPYHRLVGFSLVAGWALWVELYFDPRYERKVKWPDLSDFRDIADYLVGALAGLGILAIKAVLLRWL